LYLRLVSHQLAGSSNAGFFKYQAKWSATARIAKSANPNYAEDTVIKDRAASCDTTSTTKIRNAIAAIIPPGAFLRIDPEYLETFEESVEGYLKGWVVIFVVATVVLVGLSIGPG
jgi:hypothetical protein